MNRGFKKVYEENPYYGDSNENLHAFRQVMLTVCQLNKTGVVMLEYLIKNGYVYKGKLLITSKEFLQTTELKSKKSFYNGLDDLLKWEVIAKSEDVGFFYYNPKYFPWL
jgi:hypothetical protein